ncbi:rhamnogalacturonan acetylesterase, partial [Bacillus vallismortis]|nr:rhamnogalacturonan acetylesterase [Bacillus vallismortis]
MMEKANQVFLAGDTTESDSPPHDAPMAGWGQVFGQMFSEDVTLHNHDKVVARTISVLEEGSLEGRALRIRRGK